MLGAMMKMPLNASQTIAATAVAAVLLGGAFALGRSSQDAKASLPPAATEAAAPSPAAQRLAEAAPAAKPAAARLCDECARVVSVHVEERQGQGSGLGAIGGAVVGAVLGNQVGGGNGRKLATVGGAVAGGYAGNEIEKRHKSSRVWVVKLADRDGSTRRQEFGHNPNVQSGDVVLVRDGQLLRQHGGAPTSSS